jgi:heme/copper-type cytochrome/quinol oxidase subunit 4
MMRIAFGTVVYALCALTSLTCAVMLLRGYVRSRVKLLFWSGLCFVGLALNNIVLFIDVRVLPDTDLSLIRTLPAVAGVVCLIYGLVWETR